MGTPILDNLALGNLTQSDLILGNSIVGYISFFNLSLGNLSQCSPALRYNTIGNITE